VADSWRAFRVIAGAWVRASMTYRVSFWTMTLGQALITLIDFAAILIIFGNIDRFGGLSLTQVAVLYGLSCFALGVADLLVGNTELLGRRVRDGSFDAMLVRPVAPLVQVAADQFALRRMGRIAQAVVVLGWAIVAADIDWTFGKVAVLVLTLVSGSVIFCSVFVLGSAFQILAGDASEVMNAFTYGGNTLTQYPLSIYPSEVVKGVTFILPLAFVNWYPALYILEIDDPFGLPAAFQFASPVAAALLAAVAALAWRAGVRRYRSTGS